jgi:hypothetical protein
MRLSDRPVKEKTRYFAGFFVRFVATRFMGGLRGGSAAPLCGFGGVCSITQSTSSGSGSGASGSGDFRAVMAGS